MLPYMVVSINDRVQTPLTRSNKFLNYQVTWQKLYLRCLRWSFGILCPGSDGDAPLPATRCRLRVGFQQQWLWSGAQRTSLQDWFGKLLDSVLKCPKIYQNYPKTSQN